MEKTSLTLQLAGKPLTLETGTLAQQATSSVLARLGDTMVLVTVVAGKKESDLGYFPLSIEYVERLYAGGRIKGSRWVKREGRPSDDAILTARLIDRSVRPLFPKEYKKDVQVVVTVLSVDGENEPDILSIIAVSAALHISPIPWNGPIGAVRMGAVREKETGVVEFITNPGGTALDLSDLDLVVSQSKEKTIMIEAGALQMPENEIMEAFKKAHEVTGEVIAFIEAFAKKSGKKKESVTQDIAVKELTDIIEKSYKKEILAMIPAAATKESSSDSDSLVDTVYEQETMADPNKQFDKKLIAKAIEKVLYKAIREDVIKNGKRADGRKADEIRPISVAVDVLPRTHGSAVFQRGATQALTVATLGSPRLEQLIESPGGEESKRYMHHYSMPPYSVGETGRIGTPSRREIGHGALAERALVPVIPKQEKFPYTIRLVSEILSSNGSTSMAATCGSTLALMDAGVPIEKPVAGIAMGMMSNEKQYVILSDIMGLEDFSGDMDFKVAGTETGVTAVQLDVKIPGLTIEQVKETFDRAKEGRMFILKKMLTVIPSSRLEVSEFAPKIEQLKIPVEKIGELIGPGGRTIKGIIAQTGAEVDVNDDGTVSISGTTEESVDQAVSWIKGLTREVTPGEEFEDAEVKRILPFGAFVEFLPGKEGMVHVSKMSTEYVKNPSDVVSVGDRVKVKVVEIDDQGRVNLSMLFGDKLPQQKEVIGEGQMQQTRGERYPEKRLSTHPLTMQFRRERSEGKGFKGGNWQRNKPGSGGSRPGSKYKKSHY